MDAKGRWAVPTRHREVLQTLCAGQLTVTKHPEGWLMVFPRPAWAELLNKLANVGQAGMGWKRVLLGNAQDVEIDGAGRVLISPELRASAGLDKDVRLMGVGNYFELWDTARYALYEASLAQAGMPDALKDLAF